MAGKMADPVMIQGGTLQEILAALSKLASYDVSKEQEYVGLKILYNLSKYTTVPEFLDACTNHSRSGVTRKQVETLNPIIKILKSIVW
jgi:hypothetical protein